MEANTSRKYHDCGKEISQKHQTKLVVCGQKVGSPESITEKVWATDKPFVQQMMKHLCQAARDNWNFKPKNLKRCGRSLIKTLITLPCSFFKIIALIVRIHNVSSIILQKRDRYSSGWSQAIPIHCYTKPDLQLCCLVSLRVIQQGTHTTPHWVVCGSCCIAVQSSAKSLSWCFALRSHTQSPEHPHIAAEGSPDISVIQLSA